MGGRQGTGPAASLRAKAEPDRTPIKSHPSLSGLSASTLSKLAQLGIATRFDLVLHLPLRYDDETHLYPIAEALPGKPVLVEGEVLGCEVKYRPRRQLVCQMRDSSGELALRFFNFYASQLKQLAPGTRVRAFGELRDGFFGAEMIHPRYRVLRAQVPVQESLTPVYPATAGLNQEALRALIARALADSNLEDTLPAAVRAPLGLAGFRDAVVYLHNPPPDAPQAALQDRSHPAWQRMKFDELLAQQLSMRLSHRRRRSAGAPALKLRGTLARRLIERLPFRLTHAQRKVLAEIQRDLAQPYPMQRLLQGDVGSGKTIVAALAALQCLENGYQVAVMAPTEILAEQHYRKLAGWFGGLGVEVAWLAGGMRGKARHRALEPVARGAASIAVGTHALFQDEVEFHNLGLAVIDEQHRFGVHQRLALRMKGGQPDGTQPHQLMMSATPIPRTLAMSYYADLDVSVIDEMPPGRTPVATRLFSESRREEVIHGVRDACMGGSQAYWVCPLIEESDPGARNGHGTARPGSSNQRSRLRRRSDALQLKTALETYEGVRTTFPELKVGLVHGRLKSEDKARVMEQFQSGAIQLLVATTVIEVGVDVPNATLMVIEHAERMGLSQLHQLRGRVGRGGGASTCILLYQNPLSPAARERLRIVFENNDGFEIARHDLRLRGPGELLGARQSGVPMLRFADLTVDTALLEAARATAETMLRRHLAAARSHLARWLGERHELLKV